MPIELTETEIQAVSEEGIQDDPRWLLIQRVLKTDTLLRAEQLRKILLYVTRTALLRPDQVLREYDIALNALGRRQSFDPAQDQHRPCAVQNLRQRIDRYFLEEGKNEPMAE